MTILIPLAPSGAQEHPVGPAVCETVDGASVARCERSDATGELTGRVRLTARWTADIRPTATWSVASRHTR
jgi:hypothetical protein